MQRVRHSIWWSTWLTATIVGLAVIELLHASARTKAYCTICSSAHNSQFFCEAKYSRSPQPDHGRRLAAHVGTYLFFCPSKQKRLSSYYMNICVNNRISYNKFALHVCGVVGRWSSRTCGEPNVRLLEVVQ